VNAVTGPAIATVFHRRERLVNIDHLSEKLTNENRGVAVRLFAAQYNDLTQIERMPVKVT
jgi:hypothetical protein